MVESTPSVSVVKLYEKCKKELDETTLALGNISDLAPSNAAVITGRGSVGDLKWGKKMLNNNKLIKHRKKKNHSFSDWGYSEYDPYK